MVWSIFWQINGVSFNLLLSMLDDESGWLSLRSIER